MSESQVDFGQVGLVRRAQPIGLAMWPPVL